MEHRRDWIDDRLERLRLIYNEIDDLLERLRLINNEVVGMRIIVAKQISILDADQFGPSLPRPHEGGK